MFYGNFSKETIGHVPKRFGFCPLKMIIWRRDFRANKTFQKFVARWMEGQIAPIALLVATA
jgi:hypothetical protein